MKYPLRTRFHFVMQIFRVLLAAALALPQQARAECKEYRVVEFEDRVEAVCVGEPLTEEQKKANQEEEKRQEAEAVRQRTEDMKRHREADAAGRAQAEAERKRRDIQPVAPQKPANRNTTNPQLIYK
jgi:cobalamin-dependent methionine synthase I